MGAQRNNFQHGVKSLKVERSRRDSSSDLCPATAHPPGPNHHQHPLLTEHARPPPAHLDHLAGSSEQPAVLPGEQRLGGLGRLCHGRFEHREEQGGMGLLNDALQR